MINSFIVVFKNRFKIQVSAAVAEKLKIAKRSDSVKTFEIGENLYSISSIDMIVTKEKSYDIFPDQWSLLGNLTDEPVNAEILQLTN